MGDVMADAEMTEKLEGLEEASLKRFHALENAWISPDTLIEALEKTLHPATVYEMEISNCVRIFCDFEAQGIWSCLKYEDIRIPLSKTLARLLCQWNSWYESLMRDVWECNVLHGNDFNQNLDFTPETIRREAYLFCRVGLRIAEWVKLEHPQCKVFYLAEWAFDDKIRAEYELTFDEDGTFHYRCDRVLAE